MLAIKKKFETLVAIEKKKWELKGPVNTAIGLVLFFGIMWAAAHFGKRYWPQHVEDQSNFVFIGSIVCSLSSQLLAFLLFLPGYYDISPFYRKYQINKKSRRPWQRKEWPEVRAKTIRNVFINQFIILPGVVFISSRMRVEVRFDGFPQFGQMLKHVLLVYILDDFLFYWMHRTSHQFKFLYKFHKVHHEYDSLYTWVTQYFHPVDFTFGNLAPSGLAFMILGGQVHCFILFFWICWNMITSTQSHCGYEFPFSPFRVMPLISGASFHDFHHSKNVGNFASNCYFWDLLMGTSDDYLEQFLNRKPITEEQASSQKTK